MSEFAFFRFRSHNMLTKEEEEHKKEIVQLTEDVLQAKGIECDAGISKISEDELKEILAKVRELRKKKKKQEAAKQGEGLPIQGQLIKWIAQHAGSQCLV
jgi:hypothetical protein